MELIADGQERLDRFLARRLPEHSRSKLAALVSEGRVTVNGKPTKPSRTLEPGDRVELAEVADTAPHDLTPADIPLAVLFEDDHLLVVDKPRGLATHPAPSLREPSLVNALLGRQTALSNVGEAFRPGIVHRLDKETTGLIVIAKRDAVHVALARQIETRTAERRYLAVAHGRFELPELRVEAPIGRDPANRQRMAVVTGGKPAATHFRIGRRLDAGTVVAARLETGRTHQIRVHLRSIGHPIVGDPVYGHRDDRNLPLQLHAAYLALDHPITGVRHVWTTAPPADFLAREAEDLGLLEFR